MFYKSRKNRLRSPTVTQSILLFEEKAFWYLQRNIPLASSQENNSISFDHGGESDSPEQEAGRIELQTRLLYVYPLGFQA